MNTRKHKRALRQRFRARRNQLSRQQQQRQAAKVADQFKRSGLMLRYSAFACYMAADGEVDLSPTIAILQQAAKRVALPVVDRIGNKIDFFEFTGFHELVSGAFNLLEPAPRAAHVPSLAIGAVLLPLVAFDDKGTRLGMGGGYYDRLFANMSPNLRPQIIGVAHEQQHSATPLPREAWDIGLDAVLTPDGYKVFS